MMASYVRASRDVASNPANKASMTDIPDCVDIAFVFPGGYETDNFWKVLNETYVPMLQARGTRVVKTIGINTLLNPAYPNTAQGHEDLAESIVDSQVDEYDLDGLDIDVEQDLSSAQVQKAAGVFAALSKRLGPKSGSGKLLIYDTKQAGNTALFRSVYPYVDYVLVQSYGRSVNSLAGTWNTYKPYIASSKYMVGFSFYEENGNRWNDVSSSVKNSRAYQFSMWQPAGAKKAGVFYAIDRDGVPHGSNALVPTNYSWTRQLIAAMNP
ncbi:hypothetical protein VHEMI02197 [[Torrubiella] hemipterigena]|uniref:Endo-beta-N-acetylglucosaminidase EndoS/F2-like TIM-barrel domain-containing protein n=1 Tax=[Torrubiella] hemipterigena TaxID=1531966 RepID=A0A0A1T7I1_9HYPO|nr:hypothetical protein VHEMI02197 [[Torrubiella] hemipterigena]